MKLDKIVVGLISFILLSSFLSISVTADQLHTVRGFITVDGHEPTESYTVKLIFGDTVYENQSLGNGWYEFSFQGHDEWGSNHGYFFVTIESQDYSPVDNESIWLVNASQIYYPVNLSIDTGVPANSPPDAPTLISPEDESTTGSSSQATLSVDVFDDGDVLNVTFYRGSGSPLGTVQINSDGPASFVWSGLSASTSYSWYAVADDGLSSTQSSTWSFTTKSSSGGGGESGGGGNFNPPVFNSPPTADAGGPYIGFTPGAMIDFDGSNSTDSDGTIENYTWDFGDGNVSYEMSPSFAFEFEGTYTVELTVTDNGGATGSDTVVIDIVAANVPPAAPVISGPSFGSMNESLTYTVSASDADAEDLLFDFDWDDGESDQSGPVPSGNDSSVSHMWSVAGIYTIEVTASDNETSSAPTTKVVAIDAIILYHNGTEIGYVTDDDGDGVFDTFHGDDSSALGLMDSMYLVDVDGDGTYDVSFNETANPPTVDVEDYEAEDAAEEVDYTWLYVIIILLILVLLLLYLRRESNEDEEKPNDAKSSKGETKAAAAKKSSSQKKSGSKKK